MTYKVFPQCRLHKRDVEWNMASAILHSCLKKRHCKAILQQELTVAPHAMVSSCAIVMELFTNLLP